MDRPHTVLTQLPFLISNIRVEEEAIGAKHQGWTLDRPHTVLTQLPFLISNIWVEEEAIGAKRQGWTGRTQPLLNYRTFPNIEYPGSQIRHPVCSGN